MPELLILGASVRAAAQSALRAGLRPWGADLFGDTDLPVGCRFERISDYPDGFLHVAERGPAGPWMYTGALENRPELVESISRNRPLWGNSADVLHAVRSPERVVEVLHAAGLPCPAVCSSGNHLGGDWLVKPRAGAAGRGIARWSRGMGQVSSRYYLQERIEGEACAALYLGADNGAVFLGVTRQLVGEDWLHAKYFQYCGSIGPLPLASQTHERFEQLGKALAAGFHLRGLFGVDCVVRDGVPFPVEVNPRYTASVEVLELACGASALDGHRHAYDTSSLMSLPVWQHQPTDAVGKAILFARSPLVFPEMGPWLAGHTTDVWRVPAFADIPAAGTKIPRGKPILTFFARGGTLEECENRLRHSARDLDRLLFAP